MVLSPSDVSDQEWNHMDELRCVCVKQKSIKCNHEQSKFNKLLLLVSFTHHKERLVQNTVVLRCCREGRLIRNIYHLISLPVTNFISVMCHVADGCAICPNHLRSAHIIFSLSIKDQYSLRRPGPAFASRGVRAPFDRSSRTYV